MTSLLKIDGMSCQNCARHVREALEQVPGVEYAEVDLDAGRARIKTAGAGPDIQALMDAVGRAGFTAAPEQAEPRKTAPGTGWKFNMIFALAVAAPLMAVQHTLRPSMHGWFGWVSLATALPVQIFCGWRFYRGAWQQLMVRQANMDTLVALGSTSAFALSLGGLFLTGRVHHLYFAEAAMILGLISLGHYLEARVGERAAGALGAFDAPCPSAGPPHRSRRRRASRPAGFPRPRRPRRLEPRRPGPGRWRGHRWRIGCR